MNNDNYERYGGHQDSYRTYSSPLNGSGLGMGNFTGKRRRWPWVVGIAVVALAAMAVGGYFLLPMIIALF